MKLYLGRYKLTNTIDLDTLNDTIIDTPNEFKIYGYTEGFDVMINHVKFEQTSGVILIAYDNTTTKADGLICTEHSLSVLHECAGKYLKFKKIK